MLSDFCDDPAPQLGAESLGVRFRQMLLSKENGTPQLAQERRTMRRFDMHLPAAIRVGDEALDELLTETQNVSARGIFFYLDRPVPEGTRIEVTMTFPPHVTLTDPVRVRFSARVVRVEAPLPVSRVGVAALIEEYEFLRSSSGPDYLGKMQ